MKKLILSAMLGITIATITTSCGESRGRKVSASESIITSEIKVQNRTLEDLMNSEFIKAGLNIAIRRKGQDLYPPKAGTVPDPKMLKLVEKKAKFTIPAGATAKDLTDLIAKAFQVKAKFEKGQIVIEL